MTQPNGIIGTPDGKTLYVADIGAGKTYAYDIQKDGTLAGKRLFCAMGSDGMTIDSEGNVYLTGHGVTVFDKAGKQIAQSPSRKTGPATSASAARTGRRCSSRPARACTRCRCGRMGWGASRVDMKGWAEPAEGGRTQDSPFSCRPPAELARKGSP